MKKLVFFTKYPRFYAQLKGNAKTIRSATEILNAN